MLLQQTKAPPAPLTTAQHPERQCRGSEPGHWAPCWVLLLLRQAQAFPCLESSPEDSVMTPVPSCLAKKVSGVNLLGKVQCKDRPAARRRHNMYCHQSPVGQGPPSHRGPQAPCVLAEHRSQPPCLFYPPKAPSSSGPFESSLPREAFTDTPQPLTHPQSTHHNCHLTQLV